MMVVETAPSMVEMMAVSRAEKSASVLEPRLAEAVHKYYT